MRVNPHIASIQPYQTDPADDWPAPGGARLSLNESALGPSRHAVAAYQDAAKQLGSYGDSMQVALKAALASHYSLDPALITIGNGSEELLLLLARAVLSPGDEGLFTHYGFLVYRIAVDSAGARSVAVPERAFTADVDAILAAVTARTRILYLANPNNPTGTCLPFSAIERLHASLPKHVLLVLDAAYAELVTRDGYADGASLVRADGTVVVLRTFSKAYGLAGARLGFAYGPATIIAALDTLRPPFNVSAAAAAAGIAALGDQEHLARAIAATVEGREQLASGLAALGLRPVPSQCNFVMVRCPSDATPVVTALAERGILVRPLRAYDLPDCMRITVGTPTENAAVLAALQSLQHLWC